MVNLDVELNEENQSSESPETVSDKNADLSDKLKVKSKN